MKKEKRRNIFKMLTLFCTVVFFAVMCSFWSELTEPLAPAVLLGIVACSVVGSLFVPRHEPLAVWYNSDYDEDLAVRFPPLLTEIVSRSKWKEKGYWAKYTKEGFSTKSHGFPVVFQLYYRDSSIAFIPEDDQRRIVVLDSYFNEDIKEMLESAVLKREFIDDAKAKLTIVVEYRGAPF